mmetsp:Transcript_3777/g.6712  ORF Transcript_3777/g.6712 Transcript_3777/m.6712 type:complete len:104 (-) Transcript_3777:2-313(-)
MCSSDKLQPWPNVWPSQPLPQARQLSKEGFPAVPSNTFLTALQPAPPAALLAAEEQLVSKWLISDKPLLLPAPPISRQASVSCEARIGRPCSHRGNMPNAQWA